MASTDAVAGNAIFYAELLVARVVEGIRRYPGIDASERMAMLELVAAKLTEAAKVPEANHASE